MSQENQTTTVVLFEPRVLFRNIARNHFEEKDYSIVCVSGGFITEEAYSIRSYKPLIAIGVYGVGEELSNTLRLIHYFSNQGYDVVVWVPEEDKLMLRLMFGLGVRHVLAEERLAEELSRLSLHQNGVTTQAPRLSGANNMKMLSTSELNVLLDSARGMSAKQIATSRHNSYKTIFAHIRNACQRLGLESRHQWLELLARIEKINTHYM